MKTAILLAAHGATDKEARSDLDLVAAGVRERFPGQEITLAFTAPFVRNRLAKKGLTIPSPREALKDLAKAGCQRVVVLPLLVLAGQFFQELERSLKAAGPIPEIGLARPLLDSRADAERLAEALLAGLPGERNPDEAVVYMAHGTDHPAGSLYLDLGLALVKRDPQVFLGCLPTDPEGPSLITDFRDSILDRGLKSAWLLPLLVLAGSHAKKDLAGPGPDSWASVLKAAGIKTRPVMHGLLSNPRVVEIWLDHLEAAISGSTGSGSTAGKQRGSLDP